MKLRIAHYLVLMPLTLGQAGCAVYTATSTATYLATGKTVVDHGATLVVPNGDCSGNNLVNGQYYCEIRDISVTYNRNPF